MEVLERERMGVRRCRRRLPVAATAIATAADSLAAAALAAAAFSAAAVAATAVAVNSTSRVDDVL